MASNKLRTKTAHAIKTRIKVGDIVQVVSGSHKGARGRVLEVNREAGRIKVEDVAMVKRHLAPQKNARHPEGGIIEGAGTVAISNVMLYSEDHGRPVRTGASLTDDNKKLRVARGRDLKATEV